MHIRLYIAVTFIFTSVNSVFSTQCEIEGAEKHQELQPGTSLTLVCKVTMGTTADKLMWFVNNARIPNVVNDTLNIVNVTSKDSGMYECRGMKGNAGFKCSSKLNVFAPPTIKREKASQIILPNSYQDLWCSASGYPMPETQWLYNNTKVVGIDDGRGLFLRTTKQKSCSLLTIGARGYSSVSGTYSCVAFNKMGQDRFDIQVTVKAPLNPVLEMSSKTYVADTNQTITLKCLAMNVSSYERPSSNITWYHDKTKLTNYKTEYLSNKMTSSLTIAKVTNKKAGKYWCELKSYGEVYRKATILIVTQKGLPLLTLNRYHVTTSLNAKVNLICTVKYSRFDIVKSQYWTRNGSVIVATTSRYSIYTNTRSAANQRDNLNHIANTLTIKQLRPGDVGRYTCVAESAAVNKTSVSVNVSIGSHIVSKKTSLDTWEVVMIVITICTSIGIIAALTLRYLKRRKGRRRPSQGYQKFVYESFLTYSDKDFNWVKDKLIPLLDHHKVKYCMPCRDYEIGKALIENITDSIYQSRTVTAILSKNYMSAKKCRDELDVALYRVTERNENSLIAIRIDSIEKDELPKALRNRTFLDYNDSEERKYWESRLLKHLFRELESSQLLIT